MSKLSNLNDAIDDLFAITAEYSQVRTLPGVASTLSVSATTACDVDDPHATSIIALGPSLELYLDAQKLLRQAKTTWNSLDMCFRWPLICAYFADHRPGALEADADLRARVQRITRRNNDDGTVEFDPTLRRVVSVRLE